MRNAKILEYGFSNEEFEIRLERAQELLYKNKLDALLITIPSNLRYFTGIDTNFWESPTRSWFLVVPLFGNPIAIIPEIGEKLFVRSERQTLQLLEIPGWILFTIRVQRTPLENLLLTRKKEFRKWIFEAPESHHDHKGLVTEQVAEIQKALVN